MVEKEEENLDKYELTIDDINFDGVTAISIVEFPAIEENFQVFSKNPDKINITFAKADGDKRIITGPALIPNKEIYRIDMATFEEYYVYFSEQTVQKIAEHFLIANRNSNVTLEHQVNVNDVSLIESWIVENPENDKSKELGYEVNKGTWMVSMKINNDEIWNNVIKEGKVNGFSIEGYFTTKFDKYSSVDMDDEKVLESIIELLKNEGLL